MKYEPDRAKRKEGTLLYALDDLETLIKVTAHSLTKGTQLVKYDPDKKVNNTLYLKWK